ncbi:MAG: hypothetical protein H7X92_10035 [Chitinophagales bacterium]|nr:hypothetical protein [Hyphomicrobiales bacterium]
MDREIAIDFEIRQCKQRARVAAHVRRNGKRRRVRYIARRSADSVFGIEEFYANDVRFDARAEANGEIDALRHEIEVCIGENEFELQARNALRNRGSNGVRQRIPNATDAVRRKTWRCPQVSSSSEFVLRVGFWVCVDGSVGIWRGACGRAQRQITARVERAGEG